MRYARGSQEPAGLSPAAKSPQGQKRFRGDADYRKSDLPRPPIPARRVTWQAPRMCEGLASVERETPLQMPSDLREWVAADDLVHFVI